MKGLIAILILPLVLVGCAETSLPPCPTDTSVVWTNCFGTYTSPDGTQYVGEFKDGNYNGQGTLTFRYGQKYVGEWKDGKQNGQGTMTYPDGTVESGRWQDNDFLGP